MTTLTSPPRHTQPPQHAPIRWLWTLCLTLLLSTLVGCQDPRHTEDYQPHFSNAPTAAAQRPQIHFGIHPLHNPVRLFERYGPLIELLNSRIPEAHFILEASRNYQEFEAKLSHAQLQLALPNPYQTLKALQQGYHVFGKMADDQTFRGIVLVRQDSAIRRAADLRGQAISFPSATALAATMLPQHSLQQQGLTFGSYEARYVGSQESSIMSVLLGNTAAGATWTAPWVLFQKEFPQHAAQLRILLETPSLINNALVVHESMPAELRSKVTQELLNLHQHPQGRRILAALPLSHFEAANDASYAPVQRFISDFTRTIRPIEP